MATFKLFASMLVPAAEQAGMPHPKDEELDQFENGNVDLYTKYPHFTVFCNFQLGRVMSIGDDLQNAAIIKSVPEKDIFSITAEKLIALGLEEGPGEFATIY